MRNSFSMIKLVSVLVTVSVLVGVVLWLSLQVMSSDYDINSPESDINSPTDTGAFVAAKQMAGSHGDFKVLQKNQSRSDRLIGTWAKQQTKAIELVLQDISDDDWQLTVTFTDDNRFIWDSKRYGEDGKPLNDSLTGSYSIERGFLIAYRFDKPSAEALAQLPWLFAYWPNQSLGKHTFRFEDDYLVLGHDGEKVWFYLKRSEVISD